VDNLQPGQDAAGLNAAVGAINASGGINGHKLVASVCNDNNDPNQAAACARQAAGNPSVLAAVGNDTNYGAQVNPILAQAGIANIGPIPYSSADFTDKNSYPTSEGTLEEAGEVAVAADLLHAKRIMVPVVDVPAGRELPPLMNAALTGRSATIGGYVYIPLTATDLTSYVAKIEAGKPDAIPTALLTAQNLRLIETAQQQGMSASILVSAGTLDAATVTKDLGGALSDKVVLVTRYAHTGPGYNQFAADFAKYANSAQPMTDNGIGSWLAAQIFAKVAKGSPTVTRKSVSTGVAALKDYNTGGLTGAPLDLTATGKFLGGTVPRITQAYVWAYHVDNGKLTKIGSGPIQVFKG